MKYICTDKDTAERETAETSNKCEDMIDEFKDQPPEFYPLNVYEVQKKKGTNRVFRIKDEKSPTNQNGTTDGWAHIHIKTLQACFVKV